MRYDTSTCTIHDFRTVQDLSAAAKQKQAQIMALARQTAEQGIGDNDLKRLQRQFDSNKATFVNIDQKQRFMKGKTLQEARAGTAAHKYTSPSRQLCNGCNQRQTAQLPAPPPVQ